MRFIPINQLEGHEIIAVNIINSKMQILVREGTTLTDKMVNRLKQSGIRSVYTKERLFDIDNDQVKDVIPAEIRSKSVFKIRKAFEV